jgi:hypothetical protein
MGRLSSSSKGRFANPFTLNSIPLSCVNAAKIAFWYLVEFQ